MYVRNVRQKVTNEALVLHDKSYKLSRCAALQSHQRQKLCKNELHTNPSVPSSPHTRTKLHTKPRRITSCPKNHEKNARRKQNNFFQTFRWRGAIGPTGKKTIPPPSLNPPSPPPRTNWGTNLGSNCVRTPIYPTTYARFKTLKIRQKLGFKKFSILFGL